MERNSEFQKRLMFFYFSYAVGLVVPIVLGIVFYFWTMKMTERDVATRLQFALERSAVAISTVHREVEYLITQTIASDIMLSLTTVRYDNDRERLRTLNELVFNPAIMRSTNYTRFINDYFIVLPVPRIVLSNKGVFSFDSFHQYLFELEGVSGDEFLESYATEPYVYEFRNETVRFEFDTAHRKTLLMLHAVKKAGVPSALLILVLNERAIQAELETAVFEEGSFVRAQDHRGVSIGSAYKEGPRFMVQQDDHFPDARSNGPSIIGSYTEYAMTSPDGSIRLMAFVSQDVFSSRAAYVSRSTLIVVLSLLVIDILIVLIFSTRNARPLSRIMQMLMKESVGDSLRHSTHGNTGALGYVDNQLTYVLDKTHILEDELTKQRPILDSLLLQSLINGIPMEESELKEIISHSSLAQRYSYTCCFVVGYLSQPNQTKENIHKDIIRRKQVLETVCSQLTGRTSILIQGYGRFVAIHGADAKSPEAYLDTLAAEMNRLIPTIIEYLDANIFVGIGNPCRSLVRLNESFEEAMVALDQMAVINQTGFAAYRDYIDSKEDYYFPIELELRLMSAVRHGSMADVKEMLDRIKDVNFSERNLPRDASHMLFYELHGTVSKLNASLKSAVGDHAAVEITCYPPGSGGNVRESWFDTILDDMMHIAEVFRVQRNPSRSGLNAKAIEAFLNNNFKDSNLSLSSTAETFGVSEKYLSRYFKDVFNINFHTYIETIRLNFIRSKMETTAVHLSDLISESGYTSTITFSRAFKRLFGVSPSVYRETLSRKSNQTVNTTKHH